MSQQDKYETDTDNGHYWRIVGLAVGIAALALILCAVFSARS